MLSDVTVIGGGIAGLSAAIAARRAGSSVRLLEAAPRSMRGGNARHGRNFRIMHDAPHWYVPDRYDAGEFLHELVNVTSGDTNPRLAALLIEQSADIAEWLMDHGVRLQPPGTGVMPYSRRTAFPLGGGKAMINALYATAAELGVEISYDSKARSLARTDAGSWTIDVSAAASREAIESKSVAVCAGGVGADPAWLQAHFGHMADGFAIRGTPYADGRILSLLIDAGGCAVGDPTTCHVVPVDARGPRVDGGIVTRITAIPYGLVVDRASERVDVIAAGSAPSHYAKWGPRIAACADQLAFLVLDAHGMERAAPSALPPVSASSIASLADALDLDPTVLDRTVRAFNAAPPPSARPIATPPIYAYPMRPGLTFVHYGIKVDDTLCVVRSDGSPHAGLFAAGMIMAANVLSRGYLAGLGITLSAVFGRRAGQEAARHARG